MLHIPPTYFSRSDFFCLSEWGFVRIRSMLVTLLAVLVRASLQTVSGWNANLELLRRVALDRLPWASVLAGQLCPIHWDSQPIAQTLSEAAAGFPKHPLLGRHLPAVIQEATQLLSLQPGPGAPSSEPKQFKLQQFLYNRIMAFLYQDSVPSLLKRRWLVLRPEYPVQCIDFQY